MAAWKRDVASGLIVIVPILVTLWVIGLVFSTLATIPLPRQTIWINLIGAEDDITEIAGVALTVLLLGGAVLATGYMMRSAVGQMLERRFDGLINRIPGLRIVYNASKTAASTVMTEDIHKQRPVKIEMWNGMRLTAFTTGKRTPDGRDLVFLPTSPNITSGLLMDVDSDAVVETDERIDDALARIISAGFGDTSNRGDLGTDDSQ